MKPVKLIISAWGPYPNIETVDFAALSGQGIFLITGSTGAGKTTVFDAISFALYGNVSGRVRDRHSLRSDFATPEQETYVVLTFTHRDEIYEITRYPRYERPKKRGEGMILSQEQALLKRPDHTVIDGISEVSEAIEVLLGLNHEQFKQVSMIAQGEFLELLLADSKKRVEIFRDIFGTDRFNRIQQLLIDKSKTLYRTREAIRNKLDEAVGGIDTSSETNEGNELKVMLTGISYRYEEIRAKLKKINTLDKKNQTSLEAQIERENEHYTQLALASERCISYEKQLEVLEKSVVILQNQQQEILLQQSQAGESLKRPEMSETWRTQMLYRLKELEQKVDAVRQYDQYLKLRDQAQQEYTRQEQEIKALERDEKMIRETLVTAEKDVAGLSGLDKEQLKQARQSMQLKQRIADVRDYVNQAQTLRQHQNAYEQLQESFLTMDMAYKQAREAYEHEEDKKRMASAGILAMNLTEGTPCPVCGSTHHVCYAPICEGILSDDAIGQLKTAMEAAQNQMLAAHSAVATAKERVQGLDEKQHHIKDIQQIPEDSQSFLKELNDSDYLLDLKLKDLQQQMEVRERLSEQIRVCKEQMEAIRSRLQSHETHFRESFAQLEKMRGLAADYQSRLGDELTELDQLLQDQDQLTASIQKKKVEREQLERETRILAEQLSAITAMLKKDIANREAMQILCQDARETYRVMCGEAAANDVLEVQRLKLATMNAEYKLLNSRLTHNQRACQSMRLHLAEKEQVELEYGYVKTLEDAVKGTNKKRLSFEQYVLGAYFDQVLICANLRLEKMSQGRYQMLRVEETKDLRKMAGLDIEVLDHYTGKKRSVRSLSGGESFNAALALALGLSDMIQRHAGGIEIETLFVDEGFGTLDEASIQSAVDTLMLLAGQRCVTGIISHVGELKERIENQLVVNKTPHGSTLWQEQW